MEKKLKLNLGCGDDKRIGWENIDKLDGKDIFSLSYPDESVSAILLNHVAMYIRPEEMSELAKKMYQWLDKDGTIHMETQDFDNVKDPETLFGMGKHAGHRWVWTPETLEEIFKEHGFDSAYMPGILHGKPERDFLICFWKI